MTVGVDVPLAEKTARKLFGTGTFQATGIDGSMDFDERLQMMLFYANATAYSCPFTVDERMSFDLKSARRDSKLAASAAIPLWAEDLANVFSAEPEVDIDLEHSMERIPNAFMTVAELYLAVNACDRSKILFLDRPLSGTFSTLSRDARNLLRRRESKLTKWSNHYSVSMTDLYLAIQLGPPSMPVPIRHRFLHLSVIRELVSGGRTIDALAESLHVTEGQVRKALKRIRVIEKESRGILLHDGGGQRLELAASVSGYWDRILQLSLAYSSEIFSGTKHPLALSSEEYLTVLDVNTVGLFLLEALCQKARATGTLVIGVAKDTTATDIARSVLPYASDSGRVRLAVPPPKLKNDRAFLAILSSENPSIATPWRTPSYDSAFSTIVEIDGTFKSARKVVSREKLFARSYFQLRTLKSDPSVRSQVFLFDRPYEPSSDAASTHDFRVEERSGPADVEVYFEGWDHSPLSDLILHVLSMSDNPEVFEAFGHNQLLYLADKAVKAEVRMLKSSLRGVADLRVGGVSRRRKIFGLITTYREQRAEAEHSRGGMR